MSEFWLREISVSTAGVEFVYPEFEIHLNVEFDESNDPDRATVKLFNLSSETENNIKLDEGISISAGYEGDTGVVLLGIITRVNSYWDGVDRVCEVEAVDITDEFLTQDISKTYVPGFTTSLVLADVLNESGLEIGKIDVPEDVVYLNGKSVKGRIKTVAEDLAEDGGAKLWITNGTVYVAPYEFGESIGVLLDKDHGLLRSPSRVDSDEADWEITSLLHYRIRAGTKIEVVSATANGMFRVVSGVHESDGDAHTTTVQVMEVS